jgi:hypothetical protein
MQYNMYKLNCKSFKNFWTYLIFSIVEMNLCALIEKSYKLNYVYL